MSALLNEVDDQQKIMHVYNSKSKVKALGEATISNDQLMYNVLLVASLSVTP
jgi:hypothetical protein